MKVITTLLKFGKSCLVPFTIFTLMVLFLIPTATTAQDIRGNANNRSWGMAKDGRVAMCFQAQFVNRTDDIVSNPQILVDLSAFPDIDELIVTNITGSGFDITDLDTSSSALSATNPIGTTITSPTSKTLGVNQGFSVIFTIYADPGLWGDYT
ncbi:MAG: hypothetical protein NWP64_08165, partial [Maribacter sp.]|nr:hypothetical protein [Maribacter sp.]